MASFQETIRDISKSDVDSIIGQNGFTIWSYYVDPESGVTGIIAANDEKLGVYYLNDVNHLALTPLGLTNPKAVQFEINETDLIIKLTFIDQQQFSELAVFDDLSTMGENDSGISPILDAEMKKTLIRWGDWVENLAQL